MGGGMGSEGRGSSRGCELKPLAVPSQKIGSLRPVFLGPPSPTAQIVAAAVAGLSKSRVVVAPQPQPQPPPRSTGAAGALWPAVEGAGSSGQPQQGQANAPAVVPSLGGEGRTNSRTVLSTLGEVQSPAASAAEGGGGGVMKTLSGGAEAETAADISGAAPGRVLSTVQGSQGGDRPLGPETAAGMGLGHKGTMQERNLEESFHCPITHVRDQHPCVRY